MPPHTPPLSDITASACLWSAVDETKLNICLKVSLPDQGLSLSEWVIITQQSGWREVVTCVS